MSPALCEASALFISPFCLLQTLSPALCVSDRNAHTRKHAHVNMPQLESACLFCTPPSHFHPCFFLSVFVSSGLWGYADYSAAQRAEADGEGSV